ncbi:TIGR00730 family protein [Tremella mesenterica]|uniref:TIGR00730 family protein n=1 Tax=Tremella mesenterica TaxID=5217 RepID=A0A4Q1BLE1_TREME|nr:TIGR00730 family protein [Tremella mesenterica]
MSTPAPFLPLAGMHKPVCVFCGSNIGTSPIYIEAAHAVGKALAEAHTPMIYGGGQRGIMGVVSKACLEAGGYVHGVLPRALVKRAAEYTPAPSSSGASTNQVKSEEGTGKEILTEDYGGRFTNQVTGTMHDRKMRMAQLATGGFIVLPGGYGTFEEALEMITWNQLGIHRLPVIILNVGNFYTPLRILFESAAKAGFINPENLSLMRIVDLPGGESANSDVSLAGGWGEATVSALRAWSLEPTAGYGFSWEDNVTELEGKTKTDDNDQPLFSLFTTMRYASACPASERRVIASEVPLFPWHLRRLREAHEYFSGKSGQGVWGAWPGDERIWEKIETLLKQCGPGDYRVRVVLHPLPVDLEVQAIPAPADANFFQLRPTPARSPDRRPLVLDPLETDLSTETQSQRDCRLYKTTSRQIYDQAAERGAAGASGSHPEVLLHTKSVLLETNTSNIAIYLPVPGMPDWATPRLDRKTAPFLDGVMRRYLLEKGIVREVDLTVDDWEAAQRDGRRVIGFNGLR